MPARKKVRQNHSALDRQRITAEAARIMVDEGVKDYQSAKRKAIHRLGLPWEKNLPSNQEIESALDEYLRLFHADRALATTTRLRKIALKAMQFFSNFNPLLTGPLLTRRLSEELEIPLHVSADTPEEVALMLQEHYIPYRQSERSLRLGGDRTISLPIFQFEFTDPGLGAEQKQTSPFMVPADNTTIELCVFNHRQIREHPLSPVDGKPMRRANIKEVESLISTTA